MVLPGWEGEVVELDEGGGRSVGGGKWVGTPISGNEDWRGRLSVVPEESVR
jgi:hypothetical protein